jgi:hypothetical protein
MSEWLWSATCIVVFRDCFSGGFYVVRIDDVCFGVRVCAYVKSFVSWRCGVEREC